VGVTTVSVGAATSQRLGQWGTVDGVFEVASGDAMDVDHSLRHRISVPIGGGADERITVK
jgi:hypothetical protein